MAGRKLNAPTCTPVGSNGLSSGNGREYGSAVATVGVGSSGFAGGAPGRNALRSRPGSGATGGCSSLGVGGGSLADAVLGPAVGLVVVVPALGGGCVLLAAAGF